MRGFSIALLFVVANSGCSQGMRCSELFDIAGDEDVRDYLKSWVDERTQNKDYLLSENGDLGNVRMPGEYTVNIFFDSKIVGMKNPEARVIVGRNRQIDSFFFGEEDLKGILVRTRESDGYGFPDSRIRVIDERVASVCIDHSIFP